MSDLLERSLRVIPSGAQTWSKARSSWPAIAPSHIVRGRGAHVWSSDGREFIDLAIGLGAVTLGYQDPDVEALVAEQLADGPLFSLSHPIEVEVAEALVRIIPCAESVRFFKTGSDATSAAIRVARAYTGRDQVVSVGYHGWHDWCCPNEAGIPNGTLIATQKCDDWRWLISENITGIRPENYAAIIVEPEYAQALGILRTFCSGHGIVLIFDEVLSGFRVGSGGYQYLCGVTPDLACFSKAMGNGYAIAAVVGKREVMSAFERIGVSGTFNGDTIGLAAAKAVIAKTETTDYYKRLWHLGEGLRRGFVDAARDAGIAVEPTAAPRTHWIPKFEADDADVDPIIRDKRPRLPWRTLWRQEMIARGFLIGPAYIFSSYALSELNVEQFAQANREAFAVLASVDDPSALLVGEAAGGGVRAA